MVTPGREHFSVTPLAVAKAYFYSQMEPLVDTRAAQSPRHHATTVIVWRGHMACKEQKFGEKESCKS